MKNFYTLLFVLSSFVSFCDSSARASDVLPLEDALRATYTACVGIDENLHDLKVLAGINTAVSSVGTAAGVGAVAVVIAGVAQCLHHLELRVVVYYCSNTGCHNLRRLYQHNSVFTLFTHGYSPVFQPMVQAVCPQ